MKKEEMLAMLADKVSGCGRCGELASCRTLTVFGEGSPSPEVVFLGEAPGQTEDSTGRPFVGKAGQLLDNILAACGFRREDVYILNVLKCRPPRNRTPSEEEVSNCRPYLELQLKILSPKYVVCLGSVAAQALLRTARGITGLRGEVFSYGDAKVICTYHPSCALRLGTPIKKKIWEDMQILLNLLSK